MKNINDGCDCSQLSSANGVCNAHTISIKLAVEVAGYFVPALSVAFLDKSLMPPLFPTRHLFVQVWARLRR